MVRFHPAHSGPEARAERTQMDAPEGQKYVTCLRKFTGRGRTELKPGDPPHLLHETAAKAAVFRGDARYSTKADFSAPSKGKTVPLSLSEADESFLSTSTKADLLKRLSELSGDPDAGKGMKKDEVREALKERLLRG